MYRPYTLCFPSYCSYHFLSPIAVKFHLSRSNNLVSSNRVTLPSPSNELKPPNPSTRPGTHTPLAPHPTQPNPNLSQMIQPQRTHSSLHWGRHKPVPLREKPHFDIDVAEHAHSGIQIGLAPQPRHALVVLGVALLVDVPAARDGAVAREVDGGLARGQRAADLAVGLRLRRACGGGGGRRREDDAEPDGLARAERRGEGPPAPAVVDVPVAVVGVHADAGAVPARLPVWWVRFGDEADGDGGLFGEVVQGCELEVDCGGGGGL